MANFTSTWFYKTLIIIILICSSFVDKVVLDCLPSIPCFSPPVDVSKLRAHSLTINSTCGTPPEYYCVGDDCSLKCDATNNQTWHPPEYLLDAFESLTYWKSKNFDKPVSIQLDFRYKLILHQITVTFQFELPHGMYIQRSQDLGKTYKTIAYFATRCADIFGMQESTRYNRVDATCFEINPRNIQRQLSYAPRRDEYVAREVLKGGAVRNFYITSNVKIILQEFYTPSNFNPSLADKRKFYFSILDVDVQASCYCNGMSNQCSDYEYGTCECKKNTAGRNCERCMSLYNNKKWRFGVACEPCNCNRHSLECVYDKTKKYGICKRCSHHTTGEKCEKCDRGYYRDAGLELHDRYVCEECRCFKSGVKMDGAICNRLNGTCFCKDNVNGTLCDECKDGYHGLSHRLSVGCLECGCNTHGTVNGSQVCDKTTAKCPCKLGVTGVRCSECTGGYFPYPMYNPVDCRECNCQPSGSIGMSCDKTGQCTCRTNYYGVKCEQIKIGFYSASVIQLLFSATQAQVSSPVTHTYQSLNITDSSGNTYFVLGYSVRFGGESMAVFTQLKFTVRTPTTTVYDFYLRYVTSYTFQDVTLRVELKSEFKAYTCDNGRVKISSFTYQLMNSNISPSKNSQQFGSLCLTEGLYDITFKFPPTSAGNASSSASMFVIALLLLPNYKYVARFISAPPQVQAKVEKYYPLASSHQIWPKKELEAAKYLSYIYGSFYGSAFECMCDRLGAINPRVCNLHGGQCNCKKNIYGRTCDRCLPQFYNFSSRMGCVACGCDARGSFNRECNYHTGKCECKSNVVGRSCNKCRVRYHGMSSGKGCKPCNCAILYSVSSQCDEEGRCLCKPGVGGEKCDRCLPGHYLLSVTGCLKCKCSPIGTQGDQCDPTTGSCTCKQLTTGSMCEQCKHSYYGFSADYPTACLPCYCSEQTEECDAANDYYLMNVSTMFSTNVNNNAIQGWTSVDLNGQESSETSWDWAPHYAIERGFAKLADNGGRKAANLYFAAPSAFLGDKKSSYMYYMHFDLTQEQTSQPLGNSNVGDMIIKGKGLRYTLVTKFKLPPSFHQNFRSYKIRFYEKRWYKNTTEGLQATSMEMRKTLSDLEFVWIRGKWTKEKGKFSGLANVSMDYSSFNVTRQTSKLTRVKNVEYCTCPPEYSGQFCQNCNRGFTRSATSVGPKLTCVACRCSNHSKTCDPNNGTCHDCMFNTEGHNCEKCKAGYYGIPKFGKGDDCKECACPGGLYTRNQFSDECIINVNDENNPYRCIKCKEGYSGYRCHICSDGYYGHPMTTNGRCRKCVCNGNVNLNASSNCNTTTGECLRCLHNTIGHSCEYCRPGFYGNALSRSCRDCACSKVGSFGNNCQNITGQCNCKANVIGRQCKTCAKNTFNFQSGKGCKLCNCNELGSKSLQCDSVTGKCICKGSVIGDKCDTCAPLFYNLTQGCLRCNCNPEYTMKNSTCDATTGQCRCVKSKLGGFYSGRTCSECDVNAIGTPPQCELCHSPCYDNWQTYIDNEAADVARTHANITTLLSQFGGLNYHKVKEQLRWLRENLTYVSDVFSTPPYNISSKELQFQQIESYVIEFETAVNQTRQQIMRSMNYFENTIMNFNGSVLLSYNARPPLPIQQVNYRPKRNAMRIQSLVDAPFVMQIGRTYKEQTKKNNVSGENIFLTIRTQLEQILSANASIYNAAQKMSKAILDLSKSTTKRAIIAQQFDQHYKSRFAVSAFELKKIHDTMVNVILLQNETMAIYNNAMTTMQTINAVISQAEVKSTFQRSKALKVAQQLSRWKVNGITLNAAVKFHKEISADLKRKVEDELMNVKRESILLSQGIRDLAADEYKTADVLIIARNITKAELPVTTMEIQDLSNEVISTIINEGVINATYSDAQHGLLRAKEVQVRSQQALDVSQSTLLDIQNLEISLNKSGHMRNEITGVFSRTDLRARDLQNMTSSIERQFDAVSGEGGVTLSLLRKSIKDMNGNNMCFVNTKFAIENASIVSQFASTKSSDALKAHKSNANELPKHSARISKLYDQSIDMREKAENAARTSESLLTDSTVAENLLLKYAAQETELDALKIETDVLEAELAEILEQFEQYELKTAQCNKP